ncbi:helix-turn-helix domain-containing protein [Thermomonospora sp. CIF 1]|uniref:helix-turn-helix domain-containing protein n=1 Tax=Thermomonospora sp. CIF 1 TaxID=1916083 RepID=UPI000CC1B138|nr:MAG: hypothetical protein BUE48_013305 [Thermomonospora sp. CIF 1]
MARLGRRATYEERLEVCRRIESGESPDAVAAQSGFGRSTVFGWWRAYRRGGSAALRTRPTPGPPPSLSDAHGSAPCSWTPRPAKEARYGRAPVCSASSRGSSAFTCRR